MVHQNVDSTTEIYPDLWWLSLALTGKVFFSVVYIVAECSSAYCLLSLQVVFFKEYNFSSVQLKIFDGYDLGFKVLLKFSYTGLYLR